MGFLYQLQYNHPKLQNIVIHHEGVFMYKSEGYSPQMGKDTRLVLYN